MALVRSMIMRESGHRGGIMAGSTPIASNGVFVSYRRQETSGIAGRLYDRLTQRLGAEHVFMDVDSIEVGANFAEVIERAVDASDVLLAVIGPQWLTATDEEGHRRLDDSDDVVRLEIEAALRHDIRVVPLLVEGAAMPRRRDLPDSLRELAYRTGLVLRHETFNDDLGRIMKVLDKIRVEEEAKRDAEEEAKREAGRETAKTDTTGLWTRISRKQQSLTIVVLLTTVLGFLAAALEFTDKLLPRPESPRTSSSVSGATPTTLDKVHLKSTLLNTVSVPYQDTCVIHEDSDPFLIDALVVVECKSTGVDVVRLGLFDDRNTMLGAYNRAVSLSVVKRDSGATACPKKPGEGPWNRGGTAPDVGRLLCYVDQGKRAWYHWTWDAERAYGYAYRSDGNIKALDDWWLHN